MLKTTAFLTLVLASFAAPAAVTSFQFGPATVEATAPPTFASQSAAAFGMVNYSMSAPFVASDSRTASSGSLTVGAPNTVSASIGGVSNPGPTSSISGSAFIAPNASAITLGVWTGVPLTFQLPAHSSITFSAPYTMSYDFGSSVGGVQEQVSMRLDEAQSTATLSGSSAVGADSQSSVLSLSFDNASEDTATRTFQMHASFTFSAAPIPEPQTYALMLAGLGVLAFVVRRHKSAGLGMPFTTPI